MEKWTPSSEACRKQSCCAGTIGAALAVLIASLASATAPAQTLEQIVTSTRVRADGDSANVDVTLTNNSPRTVTAWAWTVEGRYADGSTKSHSGTVDALTDLLAAQLQPEKDAAFRPGTSRAFPESLPLGSKGDLPTSTTAKLTMVVFDDNTATGDAVYIHRLAAERKGQAARYADELAKIDEALKAPSPKDALSAYVSRLPNGTLGMSRQILGLLNMNATPVQLDFALKAFHAQQALIAAHSSLEAK
jgi:hypothetical protein